MNSIKEFHFSDDLDIIELSCSSSDSLCSETDLHVCNENCLNIKINEILDPNIGLHIWPSAPVLAKYIWHKRDLIKGKTLLELGAGTSLPSIVAAKCGAFVILSDAEKNEHVHQLAQDNMILNKVPNERFKCIGISWGNFNPELIYIGNIDIIIGSDLFYEPQDFEDIIVTVSYILRKNNSAEFWCTYEERCSDWNISHLLQKWNLDCKEIPLQDFNADGSTISGYKMPSYKKIYLFKFFIKQ